MESTGVVEIVGSSPNPCGECGDVYGHEKTCGAYIAGFRAALQRATATLAEVTPFPFKANAADRDDIEGPFCANGITNDQLQEQVERIVGHYLLNVRGAFEDAVGKDIVRRGETVPGWIS